MFALGSRGLRKCRIGAYSVCYPRIQLLSAVQTKRHVRYLWLVLGLMVRCISAFYTFSTSLSMSDPIRKTTLHASLHRIEDIDRWCNSDQLHLYDHGLSCLSRNPSLGKSGFSFSCRGYCQWVLITQLALFDPDNATIMYPGYARTCVLPKFVVGDVCIFWSLFALWRISAFYASSTCLSMSGPTRRTALRASLRASITFMVQWWTANALSCTCSSKSVQLYTNWDSRFVTEAVAVKLATISTVT
jgi:hypothetical protein